jgi:hypothetical protein
VTRFPASIQRFTPDYLKSEAAAFPCPPITADRIAAGDLCRLWDAQNRAPGILLWGDSHAGIMRGPFHDLARAADVSVTYVGRAACPPLIGAGRRRRYEGSENCAAINAAVGDLLKARQFSDVVLVARWDYYAVGSGPGKGAAPEQHYLRDAISSEGTLEENQAVMRRRLADTVDAITAAGARAWIFMETPYAGMNVPQRLSRTLVRGESATTLFGITVAEHRQRRAFMNALVAGLPLRIIDPAPAFCDEQRCRVVADGAPLYFDDNHLSVYGTRRLAPIIAAVFSSRRGTASARRQGDAGSGVGSP